MRTMSIHGQSLAHIENRSRSQIGSGAGFIIHLLPPVTWSGHRLLQFSEIGKMGGRAL